MTQYRSGVAELSFVMELHDSSAAQRAKVRYGYIWILGYVKWDAAGSRRVIQASVVINASIVHSLHAC